MKMIIDDCRMLEQVPGLDSYNKNDYVIVRSYDEAIQYFEKNGIPEFISFDHDIASYDDNGKELTGLDIVKWLVEKDMDGEIYFPENFSYSVHSSNPEGKKNICSYLNSYFKQRRRKNV